jgi:hypothetical protein
MIEHMSPACFIDVEANRLLANRARGEKWVKSPSTQEFYRLQNPYE